MSAGKRWAYSGVVLGGGVSVAANIAHSFVPPGGAPAGWGPHWGAVAMAAFWPAALFVAVEILARVGWPEQRRWSLLRWGGLVPLALVAAVVSYRHLSGLLGFYGEDGVTVAFGPLAVDGLMVVSTTALLALAGTSRVREVPELVLAPEPTVTSTILSPDPVVPRQAQDDETVALELNLPVTPALDPVPVVQSPASLTLVDLDEGPVAWVRDQLAKGQRYSTILDEGAAKFGVSTSTMKRRYKDATRATA